ERRARGDNQLNNLEFLLYYFLFFDRGLEEGRKLKLIGQGEVLSQSLELLRLTLLGPTAAELATWGTPPQIRDEWLNASHYFALKYADGSVRPVESFFECIAFSNNVADAGDFTVIRHGIDHYETTMGDESVVVDLRDDPDWIAPPYPVPSEEIPSGLAKFSVEVLGGASGFSVESPSTGFALCFNGNYVLVDAIPYLSDHLRARGIAKSQIAGVFLTHLHDDHCNLFPLLTMPRRVDLITTREIYEMAMRKLSLSIGWDVDVVAEYFNFVEVSLGKPLNYFGLEIIAHCTVHSIPTVGATFRSVSQGRVYEVCLVGDVQTFSEIGRMRAAGLIRPETETNLHRLYSDRFDLLIADGGMGAIHGDPVDALGSKSERVVFVHVDELPEKFNATFSLARVGKRYSILDGDNEIYYERTIECLSEYFSRRFSDRWISTLFADKVIKRYNTDDVIIKQGSETWGSVFLILSGSCEVIRHDGESQQVLATRDAGDFIGEMAVVTGRSIRSASVVARTPVMACEFSEAIFAAFLENEGLKDELLELWRIRPLVKGLPQFSALSDMILDRLCWQAEEKLLPAGARGEMGLYDDAWWIVQRGSLRMTEADLTLSSGGELGARPFAAARAGPFVAETQCHVIAFSASKVLDLIRATPGLNFRLRTYRLACDEAAVDWRLGPVAP
ncbi:MAG: cyclic nucleotide-binding domain-containing protein, partial [Pseudomonadota bacterium]